MSLLNKASLIQIPSGYKDGTLYSAKPTNGDGDFTFSRGSNLAATRVNSDGLIEKGRENLLLQSNQFDTTWSTTSASVTGGQSGYDGTNDAWLLDESAAGGRVFQSISGSGVMTFSMYVKSGSLDYVLFYVNTTSSDPYAYFDLANGLVGNTSAEIDATIVSAGNGYYRCSVTGNVGTLSAIEIYPANSTSTHTTAAGSIYIQDAQLEAGLVATDYIETTTTTAQAGILEDMPRLDYSGGASCPSLLLEPQRSNVLPNSEYFVTSYTLTNLSLTNNDAISPEGVQNATKLTENTSTGTHEITRSITNVVSTSYSISVYAKADSRNWIRVSSADGGFVYFNLSTGEKGTETNAVGNIVPLTNDWYRCEVTFSAAGVNGSATIRIAESDGVTSYTGASKSVYLYGFQYEEGSYPTSYIPAYGGSSVTRSADSCTDAGNASTFNSTEGVLYAEISSLIDDNDGSKSISISSGAYSNNIILQYTTNTNQIVFKTSPAYTTPIFESFIVSDITQNSKIAFKYKLNDCSFWHNGVKLGSITSFTPFSSGTLTELNFNRGDGNEGFEGKVKMVATFTEALTDDELAALTTI